LTKVEIGLLTKVEMLSSVLVVCFVFICSLVGAVDVFDHFVFSQQWPESICVERNFSHEFHCEIPEQTQFWTVHGIWPTEKNSMGPSFCDNTTKFNPDGVQSILDQLKISWPNLFTNEQEYSFWEHEWNKHGTCAKVMPELDSELKYFSKGLELQKTYDLYKFLNDEGFSPSDDKTYQYSEFNAAVGKALGKDSSARLLCFYDKVRKTQYLAEIEFCIDKSFQVMDCPSKRPHFRSTRAARNSVISMLQKKDSPSGIHDSNPHPCRSNEELAYPVIH
jgi:ribonuclease I